MSANNFWLGSVDDGIERIVRSIDSSWGPWHEIGHHYQMPIMLWDGLSEITGNLTSLYVQRKFGHKSRLERGFWTKAEASIKSKAAFDHRSDDAKLCMFWQLDLTFGDDFYARLGRRFRTIKLSDIQLTNVQKQQNFIVETSRVAGFNLIPYFKKWGLSADQNTINELDALNLPQISQPIWENTDFNSPYTYTLAQQNIEGKLVLPKDINAGDRFTVNLVINNRENSAVTAEWEVPKDFSVISQDTQSITLQAPQDLISNSIAIVRARVNDGQRYMILANGTNLHTSDSNSDPFTEYNTLVTNKYNLDKIHLWGENRGAPTGNIGDVYSDDKRGMRYFKLKSNAYYFFPTDFNDNFNWEFLCAYDGKHGEDIACNFSPELHLTTTKLTVYTGHTVKFDVSATDRDGDPLTFSLSPNSNFSVTENSGDTAIVTYTAPTDAQFYGRTVDTTITVSDGKKSATQTISVIINKDLSAYDKKVMAIYGKEKIHIWDENRKGVVGDIYVYILGDKRMYFILKKEWYHYFPLDENDNDYWTYLATGDDKNNFHKVNSAPLFTPIVKTIRVSPGKDVTFSIYATDVDGDHLSFSSNDADFSLIDQSNGRVTVRYEAPSQRALQDRTVYKTITVSDGHVSVNQSIKIIINKDLSGYRDYEKKIMSKNKVDKIYEWGENGSKQGVIGNIYSYLQGKTIRYFKLKRRYYWYFPTYAGDNDDWEFLDEYNGE